MQTRSRPDRTWCICSVCQSSRQHQGLESRRVPVPRLVVAQRGTCMGETARARGGLRCQSLTSWWLHCSQRGVGGHGSGSRVPSGLGAHSVNIFRRPSPHRLEEGPPHAVQTLGVPVFPRTRTLSAVLPPHPCTIREPPPCFQHPCLTWTVFGVFIGT